MNMKLPARQSFPLHESPVALDFFVAFLFCGLTGFNGVLAAPDHLIIRMGERDPFVGVFLELFERFGIHS